MLKLYAQISGITRLALSYPIDSSTDNVLKMKHTMKIGIVRYRNCVNIEARTKGLFLWIHPPLGQQYRVLIPWDQIIFHQNSRLYGRKAVQLTIDGSEKSTITVYNGFYKLMQPYLKHNSP